MKKPSKATVGLAFAATTLILPLIPAQAATYYWKPNSAEPGLWTELSNWSTESIAGAVADALPGAGDILSGGDATSNDGNYNFDLGGGDYTISGWNVPGDWDNHYLTLANGSLTFSGSVQTHSGAINVGSGGVLNLASGSEFSPGLYSGSGLQINVNDGGEMNVAGTVRLYNGSFNIASGGTMTFSPSNLRFGAEDNGYALSFSNAGTLNLPNGFGFKRWDILTVDHGATYAFAQTAGTLNLGGSFSNAPSDSNNKPGPFTVTISGGTVNVTGDVAFNVTSATIENNVTFNFDSAHTVDFTGVVFGQGASITKTGAAAVALPVGSVPIAVSDGGLALGSGTYDLSSVTFSSGTTIALASLGGTVNSYDSSLAANATFTADLSGATVGTVVFISSDSTLRSKVATDLADSLPSGMSFVTIDNALILTAETAYDKIYDASGEIADIPGSGSSIAITGSGTVVTLSTAESIDAFKALGLIEVKNGAKLTISTDVDALPPIKLNMDATLEIAGNATVTLADQANLSCVAMASHVPALSVASGATLNVPGGMKFSNIGISLQGTIASTSAGGITFGYAGAGETAYIGLSSSGGTISVYPGSGDYNTSVLAFCYPEVGGTVNAVGSLSLASTTILPRYTRSGVTYNLTTDYQIGLYIGVNNPAATPFEVVFDNTSWGVMGSFYIKGGATLRLSNGSSYQNFESLGYWGRYAEIAENGKLVVGNGCEFRLNALGDYGTHEFAVNPSTTGHQAIVVEDGGVFENYRFSGNGKAAFIASNSVYRIYMPSIYCEYEHSDHSIDIYDNKNVPFEGFASVDIADGDTMTFTTRNMVFWDVGQFASTSGARVVTLADVPITGGGSVALSNNDPNIFGVIVRSGANAATGTASVVPPAAGKGDTTLYFANGANWAGTVVADGNVAITNLVDAASPVTCSFGTLNLAADFPIRVWKSEGVVTNDTLNVGTYTGSGCIRVTGAELDKSEVLTIGTIGENAELPAKILVNGARYEAFVDNGFLKAKAVSGMTIVIR